MGLEVDAPSPPELAEGNVGEVDDVRLEEGGDVHRGELEAMLADGAWERGFYEWADHTDLDEPAWTAIMDLGLLDEFDFFWDGNQGRVGYSSPGIPPNWRQRDLHPALDSWSTVSSVNAGLSELGRTVADVLTQEYVDWDDSDDRDDA